MSDRWEELQEIFEALYKLEEPERSTLLDERCQRDPQLRDELVRLFRAHESERRANSTHQPATRARRFGVWNTTSLLGRGGMGEVWMALRADGQIEQTAAVKILSPHVASPDSVERFRRERQLLAHLEHPNIARLLDGGVSEQSEPYLVMEYVEGTRLDAYCDEQRLPIRDRLRLFLKVCAAVNFAHQHFVVHRDLKPSNILVTRDGQPKLLDFGIAKVIDAEQSLQQTATSNLYLTPLYASPEILRGEPATVASDVYSLGVILYELLSGERPYDTSSPASLMQAITEKDPRRLSVAGDPEESAERARSRATSIEKLRSQLSGDLESIVMKALAKSTQERYGSAIQLADDLANYLAGRPVTAIPHNALYLAKKFIARNRLAVSAAAMIVLTLIAGLAGTTWQARKASQQRAMAEARFNEARQLAGYLLFDLYDQVEKADGTLPIQADMASRSLQYLDRLAAVKSSDENLQWELARGYLKLGTIFGSAANGRERLTGVTKAVAIDRKALAIAEPLLARHPKEVESIRTMAAIQEQLGSALAIAAQYKEAFERLQQAAETFERIATAQPNDVRALEDAASAWHSLGSQMSQQGGFVAYAAEKPMTYLQKSVTELSAAIAANPNDSRAPELLAISYESVGRLEGSSSPAKATEAYTRGLEALSRLPEQVRKAENIRHLDAMLKVHIGWDQGQLGDFKSALENLHAAQPVMDEIAAADPQNATLAYHRMDLYRSLGLVEAYADKLHDSLRDLRQAVEILDDLVARDPDDWTYAVTHAELQGRVATLLVVTGSPAAARPFAQASIAFFKKVGDSPRATAQEIMEAIRATADTEVKDMRDYPAALRFALRADQMTDGKNPAIEGYLAEAYALNGRYPDALEAVRRGLSNMPAAKTGESPSRLRQWLESEARDYEKKSASK